MDGTILEGRLPSKKNTHKQKSRKCSYTNKERKFKCDVCSMSFKTISIRNTHMLVHSDKQISCEICSRKFPRKHQLQSHIPSHFKGYGLTKQDFATMQLNVLCFQYKPILKTTELICPICSEVFRCNDHLRCHAAKHSNFKPYCCEICSRAFKRPNGLRTHFKSIHPDHAQNYKDYSRIDETNVEDIWWNLDENKKFQCDVCSKGFASKDAVKLHLFSHFNIKPFECKICSKRCKSKPLLRKHLRKHVDREPITPVTQLTMCKQEVVIDEQGFIEMFDIKPSKVVLRRSECHFTL